MLQIYPGQDGAEPEQSGWVLSCRGCTAEK